MRFPCKQFNLLYFDVFLKIIVAINSRWSNKTAAERAKFLIKMAESIEENIEILASAESRDQGKPVALARRMDIPRAALNFRAFAESICHHLNM